MTPQSTPPTTTTMDFPVGVRFNPTEDELVSYYLRKRIQGHPLSDLESQFFIEVDMYGDNATPWELFSSASDSGDNDRFVPWHLSLDPSSKVKLSEGILYVLTKLSNVGNKMGTSDYKQKNRVAGCGTWHVNNTKEPVTVPDKNGDPIVIGFKKSFTFRSSTHQTVGQWNMIEYNINATAYGMSDTEFNCEDYVLCKIKRDDTKSSLDGKLVSRKRKITITHGKMVDKSLPPTKRLNNKSVDERGGFVSTVIDGEHPVNMQQKKSAITTTHSNDNRNGLTRRGIPSTVVDQRGGSATVTDSEHFANVQKKKLNVALTTKLLQKEKNFNENMNGLIKRGIPSTVIDQQGGSATVIDVGHPVNMQKQNPNVATITKLVQKDNKSNDRGESITVVENGYNANMQNKKRSIARENNSNNNRNGLTMRDVNLGKFRQQTRLEEARRNITSFRKNDKSSIQSERLDPFLSCDRFDLYLRWKENAYKSKSSTNQCTHKPRACDDGMKCDPSCLVPNMGCHRDININ